MTPDDIRKLLGGYATDSLTPAERKILFEAALDDQELFDELAQEQALKEMLEEPGAKPRLIASLAPSEKAWWRKPWPWVAVAAAAIAVSIVVVNTVLLRPPVRQEIAEARIPGPRMEAQPRANVPATPPNPEPAAAQAPRVRRQESGSGLPAVVRKTSPIAPQDSLLDKAEAAKGVDAVQEAAPGQAPVAPPAAAAPPPAPPAPTPTVAPRSMAEAVTVNEAVAAGARGGGGMGAAGQAGAQAQFLPAPRAALPAAAKDLAISPPRFAFDYSVMPNRVLRILPAADGFLTVSVINGDTSQVLISGRAMQSGSALEILVPVGSTLATIVFSRTADTGAAGAVGGLAGATDPPSGTKADPAPSPTSRLQAIIPLSARE